MTDQTFDRDYAERSPEQEEARIGGDTPLAIGSRTRGPDERRRGTVQQEDSDRGVRNTLAGESLGPAFARQTALAMEQEAVRIRRLRFEQISNAGIVATTRREEPFVPAPTVFAVTATLFQREARYFAEAFRRFFNKK